MIELTESDRDIHCPSCPCFLGDFFLRAFVLFDLLASFPGSSKGTFRTYLFLCLWAGDGEREETSEAGVGGGGGSVCIDKWGGYPSRGGWEEAAQRGDADGANISFQGSKFPPHLNASLMRLNQTIQFHRPHGGPRSIFRGVLSPLPCLYVFV